jgi:bifunctional non-homologous end joining protein LigD
LHLLCITLAKSVTHVAGQRCYRGRRTVPTAKTGRWGEGITADDMPTLTWVKPMVVAEIAFTEWTAGGNLRHASFVGLREDKDPKRIRRE